MGSTLSLAFVSAEEFNYSQYESIKPEDFKKVISENTKKGNGPTLYQKKIEIQVTMKELPKIVTQKEKAVVDSIVAAGNLNADNAKFYSYFFRANVKDQKLIAKERREIQHFIGLY